MSTIRDVMSSELVTVSPATTVAAAAALMSAKHVGSALILDAAGSLTGIFTERDILHALGSDFDAAAHTVQEWMSKDPATIEAGSTVTAAIDRMLEGGFRHLPVVDDGALVGVVSLRDLSRGDAD